MGRAFRGLSFFFGVQTLASLAWAAPVDDFQTAENTFRYHDYPRAIELLQTWLKDNPDSGSELQVKAREYLAASYWFERASQPDYLDRCQEWLQALLLAKPDFQLDAFYYPPEFLRLFEEKKQAMLSTGVIRPPTNGNGALTQKKPVAEKTIVEKESIRHERTRGVCLVPFGVGQFYNGDTAKGVAFLTTETLALGTNIASYLLILSLRENSGRIAHQNMGMARDLRIVLYASLGVYLALTAGGIVEALVSFKKTQVENLPAVERRLTPAPDSVLPSAPSPRPTSSGWRLSPGYGSGHWFLSFETEF